MSILAIIASSLLLIPATGDPSAQPPEVEYEGVSASAMPTAFFGGEGVTGVTYTIWMRWRPSLPMTYFPFVQTGVSYQTARATREGGDELANLISDEYMTNALPLTSGTWSANCLNAVGNLAPSGVDSPSYKWQYGCYCVNYKSDSGFTLNVGGTEQYCSATNTMAIFNIVASTSSRTVSISADSASAQIYFGIAHNPLVQFIGGTSSQVNGSSTTGDIAAGGIHSNEWRMCVFRARIDGGTNMVTLTEMWRPTSKCTSSDSVTQAMWQPRSCFATNSRVRVSCAQVAGGFAPEGYDPHVIRWYSPKGKDYWMTDEEIELWRDKDYVEIQRRGM